MAENGKEDAESEHVKIWGGESRLATLFFVNFVNTATTRDKVATAQSVIYLVDAMQAIENVIEKYGGTANRILPDNRILAAFGIPRTHRDDPERALDCIMAIKKICDSRVKNGELGDWRIAIGVNRGWVFFGYVVEKLSYLTVIGDTVNVAARIAQICPAETIYLSGSAYDNIANLVQVENIGERAVKGRTEVVKIYKLIGPRRIAQTGISSRFPLLGREKEFERLVNLAQEMKEQCKLRLCAITGQMGIGKTRLKEEFREHLLKTGEYNVYESYCAVEIHTSYYPFRLFLKEYLGIKEFDNHDTIETKIDDYASTHNLTSLDAQGIKYIFSIDSRRVSVETMSKVQEMIFSAVRNFLRNACQDKPLVLILEEFNRADVPSKTLVSYLAKELSDSPVLILMVNFTDDTVVPENTPLETINLGPLSGQYVAQLIKHILEDVDEKLVEFVYRISGGNPLFTIETIRSIQRTELIKRQDSGQWILEKEKRLPFLEDLYGVVMSGIDSLSATHRLIIDYASVIGYTFTHQLISNLLGNMANLQERLDFLKQEDYIVQFRGGTDPVYIFRHNLLRDAVYTTLPMRKRRELHRRIGELYETIYADTLFEYYENLAQQFYSCEEYGKAARYFKLSGDRAKTFYSIDPAINYYNTVLRIEEEHKGMVDFETMCDCRLNLTDLCAIKGDIQRMYNIAEDGKEEAHKLNVLKWILYFTERIAFAKYLLGDYAKAEELLLEASQRCNEQLPELLTTIHTELGIIYLTKGEPEKSLLNYNLAWVTAQGNNLEQGKLPCLINLSVMHRNLGNYELCLEYLNYALRELIKESDILNLALIKYHIGEIYFDMWNIDQARELFHNSFRLTEQVGFEMPVKAALYLALISAMLGREKEVQQYLEFVDKKFSPHTREVLLAEINLRKAAIFSKLGQTKKANDFANNALKIAQKLNNREYEFWSHVLMAEVDLEKTEELLKNALQIAENLKFPPFVLRVLYQLTKYYYDNNHIDKAQYYGRKALFVFDDIKAKLQPQNRDYYVNHPEYSKLLEM